MDASDDCLALETVLQAFSAPINEEQCWALAHQTLQLVLRAPHDSCALDAHHLYLARDGHIHPKSLSEDASHRVRTHSRNELLASLGVVLFHALDFGLQDDEERSLSRPLELLIESLTSCDPSVDLETKDEGIERDCDHSCDDVIQKCISRLASRETAESHYRAVVRALHAETLELRSFLTTVARGKTTTTTSHTTTVADDDHERQQCVHEWARLWVQVIRQLRAGVQLRKVERESDAPRVEFALTPFEMLLDDIRLKRYALNKVQVTSHAPQKDAHDLILEFIRSRPPLAPASRRTLKEAPHEPSTLYEKLMRSIRERDHQLRPTPCVAPSVSAPKEKSVTPGPTRRLIKADLNLRLSSSFDDDEDDMTTRGDESREKRFSLKSLSLKLLERRHSVSESPHALDVNEDTRQHVAQIWQSTEWGRALQCLSLSLQEVQHIRSVLTKAELETLAVTRELREDLEGGRICFTCLKTRFSFFGARPHTCKVCERAICERCATRMHIPCETFDKVPIYMLSPTPSPPLEAPQWAPPKEPPKRQMERRLFALGDQVVVDAGLRKSGPLVRVCRDCKALLRHLIGSATAHF